jgi:AraC family transcriptional regulator
MDHLTRLQRAVDYIEANLLEELPLERIAREAAFSMWHFQRVFSAAVGDTVKDYVRKRRLGWALAQLRETERRMLEIALDCGYESQEAFTRAFKAQFGATPGAVRSGEARIDSFTKPRITYEYLDHLHGGMTMDPKIEDRPEMRVLGMGSRFISVLSQQANNFEMIPKLWDAFNARRAEIPGSKGWTDYGVCEKCVDPESQPEECFYLAGAEVDAHAQPPAGMIARVIPAGRYAVFTHRGALEKLEHTMKYIYGSWLPRSGEQLRDAPDLEVYGPRFKYGSEESELGILIPIV